MRFWLCSWRGSYFGYLCPDVPVVGRDFFDPNRSFFLASHLLQAGKLVNVEPGFSCSRLLMICQMEFIAYFLLFLSH